MKHILRYTEILTKKNLPIFTHKQWDKFISSTNCFRFYDFFGEADLLKKILISWSYGCY